MLQMFKRITSIFLVMLMVFSGMPVAAVAEAVSNASAAFSLMSLTGTQITRLELEPRSAVIANGASYAFRAKLTGGKTGDVTDRCTWTSDNESIATVDGEGNVTGVGVGSTRIHCTYGVEADQVASYAYVTVTEVKYKVTYESGYPEDAKKYVYENGNTAYVADAADTHVTYSYQPGEQTAILGGIFSTINYDFLGYRLEGDTSERLYQPGETLSVQKDMKLTAQWRKNNNSVQAQSIQVRYHHHADLNSGFVAKNAQAVIAVSSDNEREATVTFVTANMQDSINGSNSHSKYYAWRIGERTFDFNTQATVTATKDENGNWIVDAYPVAQEEGVEGVYTQFFVRRRNVGAEAGDAIGNYHSVGIGLIDMDKLRAANPNWDGSYVKGVYAGNDNMTQDVGGFILEAPSAAHIADLMNVTLNEGESVKWYVVKFEDNGWHVDGILHPADKYHRVEFVDPLDGNRLVKTVLVKDSDPFKNEDTPQTTPTGDGNRDIAFLGWSLTPDGSVLPDISRQLGAITKDEVLYARYSVEVNYRSDDPAMGKVSRPGESVGYGDDAQGSVAQPERGYRFVKWVKEGETDALCINAAYGPTNVTQRATYVAYFEKDETQVQPTKYTVKYTIEGEEQPEDRLEEMGSAWVNDDPARIEIAKGGIPTPADKYEGYELDAENPEYPAAGTLVESGSEYVVNYVRNEIEPPVEQLNLTVNYWYDQIGGMAAANSYMGTYSYGQSYNVASPRIAGYTADLMNVTGTITEDTTLHVVYTRKSYTLTVQYRYLDGTIAADDFFEQGLSYGDAYEVVSPVIDGYVVNQESVSGVMPEANVVLTVYYAPVPPEPEEPEEPTVTPKPEEPEESEEPTATPKPEEPEEPTATPKPEESEEPTATPKPEESEEPTVTPKPEESEEPTATPKPEEPEESEEPTATPKPEEPEEPTATPEPEESEEPTVTPKPEEPEESEEPSVTPKPEESEEPSVTPKPEESEEPTATPEPEESEEPTVTPEPTATPEPTVTPEPVASAEPSAPAEPERPRQVFVQIDEYGIPLSLGSILMNVGDCFE